MAKHYVVYSCEQLRDGREEWSEIVGSLEAALYLVNKYAGNTAYRTTTFRVFELGKEIPISQERIEEPQPPKVETRYKLTRKDD